jgi:hypothetical protein
MRYQIMVGLFALTLVACSHSTEHFRKTLADEVSAAATAANIPIDVRQMVTATRNDLVVANVPVIGQDRQDLNDAPMFVYVSGNACAKVLPNGFYTVRTDDDFRTGRPTSARFVDGTGRTAATVKVEVERRAARPADANQVGVTLRGFGAAGTASTSAAASGLIILGTCSCTLIVSPTSGIHWLHLHTVVV